MDHYRSTLQSITQSDIDSPVLTMDEIIKRVSPPIRDIKPGETLTSIARQYGVSIRELLRLNPGIKNPNEITAGDPISVPFKNEDKPKFEPGYQPVDPSEDAIEPAYPEAVIPLVRGGAALASTALTKGLAGLARAAPPAIRAGVTGDFRKGAVHWPGAKQAFSNVRPITGVTGNPGATRALLQSMQPKPTLANGARLPMGGGSPPMNPATLRGGAPLNPMAGGSPPMNPATLRGGAPLNPMAGGSPPMDPSTLGGGAPLNASLLAALQLGRQKINGGQNENIIQRLIQQSRR